METFNGKKEPKLHCGVNEYVVYRRYGICKVEDIRYEKFSDKEELYYVLSPVYEKKSTVYLSVDSPIVEKQMHPVLNKDEINNVITETEKLDIAWIDDSKKRQNKFEEILCSGNRIEVLWLIKVLSFHKKETEKKGHKFYASDEKILTTAEKIIKEEFAFVLGIDQDEVVPYILEKIKE